MLAADPKVSLADSMALQTDSVSPQARRLVAITSNLRPSDPDVAPALGFLWNWNGNETVESVEAAIYETWATKHLGKTLVARVTPEKARDLVGNGHLEAVLNWLENPTVPPAQALKARAIRFSSKASPPPSRS